MPSLTLTGELLTVYHTPAYTDRKTGEVTPEAYRLQILETDEIQGQPKFVLHNIKTEHPREYRNLVGRTITIPNLKDTTINGRRFFYIPKGSPPPSVES